MRARVLKPQLDLIAGKELVILHGLRAHQDVVRSERERRHELLRSPTLEVRVLQFRRADDRVRVDTEQVLEVGSDIGQSMLHRFDRRHTGRVLHARHERRAERRARTLGHGDIGAVDEQRVDARLLSIGGVEDGGRHRERTGQRHECHAARKETTLPAHPGRHGVGERAGNGSNRERQRTPAPSQQELAEPPDQECATRPEQRRSGERPIADGDAGLSFGGEHELVSAPAREPVDDQASEEQQEVEAVAGPAR